MIPLPPGPFSVICSDPPWDFKVRSPAGLEGRPQHYARMTLDEIKALPVASVAAPHCFLFLWTTGPHLPQAFEVIKAWGFEYSGIGFTWIKLRAKAQYWLWKGRPFIYLADLFMGGGYGTRKNSEICLCARRGNPARLSANVKEVIISPRREHSRKPVQAMERIEKFCGGPRLEMFSRESRPGWTSWGLETDKFNNTP